MKIAALVMLVHFFLAKAADTIHQEDWEDWKKTYNKVYGSSIEEARRLSIWEKNNVFVEDHNHHASEHGFTLGMNKFADRDEQEMGMGGGLLQEKLTPEEIRKHIMLATDFRGPIPASVDWRDKGAVLEVKDQKNCNSCWAFGVTGVIEGQNYLIHNSTEPLSEQNLIDCSWKFGNNGCNGGNGKKSYQYILSNGGIETEKHYPYTATDKATCQYNALYKGASITDYKFLPQGDEVALTNAIANIGPILVSIDATKAFYLYNGTGVFYDTTCTSHHNHNVLIVGYGTENGRDYYTAKNSWGIKWGAAGYIKMSRNRNNNCGIANFASYPIM